MAPVINTQGNVKPFTVVDGPDAWTADQWKTDKSFIHTLSDAEIVELDAAVARNADVDEIQTITKDDFVLPSLGAILTAIQDEVTWGRGFALIRGVPVDRYTRKEALIAYWGIGLYWGKAVPQNKKGHLIGHIKDIGHDPANPITRLYATSAAQPYHNDSADIVALLCLKNAPEGGLSSWSSSVSVHNRIVSHHPHLAPTCAGPWFYDRKGEVPAGKQPFFEIPIFNYNQGYLSVNFSDNYYFLSQRHTEVPRLTEAHLAAIKVFNEYARSDELRMDHLLQPGEIQLLNNHTMLHSRSAFVDHPDIDQRRHLLRLWLAPAQDRPLPPVYSEILGGSVQAGDRGGIRIQGFQESIVLEAE